MSEIAPTANAISTLNPPPWYQLPNEPHEWYQRFAHYYLTQPSTNRSVLQAYRSHRIAKANTDEERAAAEATMSVGEGWYQASWNWQWIERANARDRSITDRLLEQNGEALLTHKAITLQYWTGIVQRWSRELASRDPAGMSETLLTRTIKTMADQIRSELPQQPQLHAHVIALHPELQALIRDAIEKRK